jgi:hypothetical protein
VRTLGFGQIKYRKLSMISFRGHTTTVSLRATLQLELQSLGLMVFLLYHTVHGIAYRYGFLAFMNWHLVLSLAVFVNELMNYLFNSHVLNMSTKC